MCFLKWRETSTYRCEETGVEPLCPDDQPNDWNLGGLEDLVKCNREKWWSPSNNVK